MTSQFDTKEKVLAQARTMLERSLRDVIPPDVIGRVETEVEKYAGRRKGYLGELVERFVFELDVNSRPEADFKIAGVELKTTPLKRHPVKKYVSKERLVFSMIDYDKVVGETWETSSFLKKNKLVLLLFYLWLLEDRSILDHKFKFAYLLDLIDGISAADALQIRRDWEYIVQKIQRGEAHLLSEADTYYLGACTKAANSSKVRDQPRARTRAKPRAFSFKQQYLTYLVQKHLLHADVSTDSLLKTQRHPVSIEQAVQDKFAPYINKTDEEICNQLGLVLNKKTKQYKRTLANRIMGVLGNHVEELDKANVTLRAITLESNGTLRESVSFAAFDYKDLLTQVWYDEEGEQMSDFHAQLESKKFMFVVFQKTHGSDAIVLRAVKFWNFPMSDIEKARDVWERTVDLVREGKVVQRVYKDSKGKTKRDTYFPGSTYNGVVHVRPHGSDSNDVSELPTADQLTGLRSFTKQCFWLNAKYLQAILNVG